MVSARLLVGVMLASALPGTATVAATAPAILELVPSSPWNMRYQDGSCELMRRFGSGEDQITVQFSRTQPANSFGLRLFGQPFRNADAYQDVRVAFGDAPAAAPLKDRLSGLVGKVSFVELGSFTFSGPWQTISSGLIHWSPDQEATINALTIGPHRGKTYRLKLGSMRAPMQALRTCTDDLVRSWGYDPVAIAGLLRPVAPLGSPAAWVHSNDYPAAMLRQGNLGLVSFRLDADEVGKVVGCTILRRAGDDTFAKKTCEALSRRAQFVPALDSEGKPVRSFWASSARWIIPE